MLLQTPQFEKILCTTLLIVKLPLHSTTSNKLTELLMSLFPIYDIFKLKMESSCAQGQGNGDAFSHYGWIQH